MRVAMVVIVAGVLGSRVAAQTPAWQDLTLPFERRAADLVARMTLDEKVSQMMDRAPAIDRLGIPEYNWWNEGLHGVARSGLATSFPQAIGLAATWDDSLVFRMATVISDEFRAKYHDYLRKGEHQRYEGLTVWSPNINLLRDPRWGRGQETYGEDPYLTGRLAVAFIRGLQGNDPRYLKTIATVKHFAVHSGPEPLRHTFDAVVPERDLRESYLPHFEAGIREGGAYSLMCAYNRVFGAPACSSELLLQDILRGEWRFPGYVVSDCGAIDDIYLRHHVVPTAAAAAALGVRTETDLECGGTYTNLVDAVHQGLVSEAVIDSALTRLFVVRFRLGMFDPADSVRWAKIPITALDQPPHRALALQVARESMVLLKNAGHVLPLRRDLGTIAVIGPNADDPSMLLGNYNGSPADSITPLRGIREAVGAHTRVLYVRGSRLADGVPAPGATPDEALAAEAVRVARQADVVVLCLGLTARLEGEEMPVAIPGFSGGDRTSLDLPAPQERLLERIVGVGKPTVLVLLTGSAVAVRWPQAHVPAIVEAWYPGQAGGTALAQVLFGDYDPAGRLPVTFYRDVADLPAFDDYRMAGRTYRFFAGAPLYAFGFGLSYTTFRYDHLRLSRDTLEGGGTDTISVSVDVTNTGARAGDEVVQLYVRFPSSSVARPKRDLRGFRRVPLAPGETRAITFPLGASALRYWDPGAHRWAVENGPVVVEVGASSADLRVDRTLTVTGQR